MDKYLHVEAYTKTSCKPSIQYISYTKVKNLLPRNVQPLSCCTKFTLVVNGCASLARVELDDLNKDLVTQMDLRYSEHATDSGKIPKQKHSKTSTHRHIHCTIHNDMYSSSITVLSRALNSELPSFSEQMNITNICLTG